MILAKGKKSYLKGNQMSSIKGKTSRLEVYIENVKQAIYSGIEWIACFLTKVFYEEFKWIAVQHFKFHLKDPFVTYWVLIYFTI